VPDPTAADLPLRRGLPSVLLALLPHQICLLECQVRSLQALGQVLGLNLTLFTAGPPGGPGMYGGGGGNMYGATTPNAMQGMLSCCL
jgi:hypothetical protein